ncbi:putative holliday junction resolvase [Campylobacter phage F336]|uniref:Putative holliday junction resolvase n=1 Tax=Campylobacter phage F336 TaxID=2794361 RepID=A0A7T3N1W7_9CAUD|nr:putative holliday junction resolvase [Campylobacter phage F336]
MANKSKSKGNTFERTVAKMLSDNYADVFNVAQSFQRNISSGSVFGGSNSYRGMNVLNEHTFYAGDIICPSEFKYTIECKHYATAPSFNSLIIQECAQWDKWILQVEADCEISNKLPMLVVKYDNIKPFVFIKHNFGGFIFKYKDYYVYNFEMFIKEYKKELINNVY